jgi:ABC-type glycerol-3-phosphate transport system substrate-binding protein
MRVTHYARRLVAAGSVALAIAACSGDSNAPSEFNAQGTTADRTAAQAAFQ